MILFEKRAAIQAFYYLMAVDGEVSPEEIECFNEIGNQIDPEDFPKYREDVIAECATQMQAIIDPEDQYDVALEGLDKVLLKRTEDYDQGVTLRFVVWNLLVIAFSNSDYSALERRLIKHIVRVSEMDRSVFFEMEQIVKTSNAVEKELLWINQSNRPYAEIRPIVDELEKRRRTILACATQLLTDELYVPVEKVELPGNAFYKGIREGFSKLGGHGRNAKEEESVDSIAPVKPKKGLFNGLKRNKQEKNVDTDETEPAADV